MMARVIDADTKLVKSSCRLESYNDRLSTTVLNKVKAQDFLPNLTK